MSFMLTKMCSQEQKKSERDIFPPLIIFLFLLSGEDEMYFMKVWNVELSPLFLSAPVVLRFVLYQNQKYFIDPPG